MKKKKNPFKKHFDSTLERKDYSSECTMDDDHDEHCWNCECFVFPIGCMKGEEELLEKLGGIKEISS